MDSSWVTETNFWLDDKMEYELKTEVGQGVFATVWKAEEKVTRKVLAVKVYRRSEVPQHEIRLRCTEKMEEQTLLAARGGVSTATGDHHQKALLSLTPDLLPWRDLCD
jgi:serine/threonine protein kinase